MLTEIAFTPAVFEEDAQEDKSDWRDQLKEILGVLAPRTGVTPIVVSDLYDSAWFHEVERTLKAVEDHKLKPVCQGLLTKMKERLVKRPYCNEYPTDDAGWCQEALASHAVEAIDRIVATQETRDASGNGRVRSVDEVVGAGFWHDVNDRASPNPYFEDQTVLLRKLCLHANWVAFCSPYATTSEMDFTIELLKVALARPAGFDPLQIEVHFDNWDRGSSCAGPVADRPTKQQRAGSFIATKLAAQLPTTSTVDFFCWEKLLERMLIAGDFTTDGNGAQRRRARWGLRMTHVARKRRPKPEDAPPADEVEQHGWFLMDKQEMSAPFDRLLDDVAATRPASYTM